MSKDDQINFASVMDKGENIIFQQAMHMPDRLRRIAEKTIGLTLDVGSNAGGIAGLRKYHFNHIMKTINVDIDMFDIPFFVRADAVHLPFRKDIFDTVVAAEIFEHVEDWEKVYDSILSLNPPVLFVSVPDSRVWDEDTLLVNSADFIYKLYDKNMAKVRATQPEFYITEDKLFKHMWHVRDTYISTFIDRFDKDFMYINIFTAPLEIGIDGKLRFKDIPYIVFELRYVNKEIGKVDQSIIGRTSAKIEKAEALKEMKKK